MGNFLCNNPQDSLYQRNSSEFENRWTQHENTLSESDDEEFHDSLQIDRRRKSRQQEGPKTDYSGEPDSQENILNIVPTNQKVFGIKKSKTLKQVIDEEEKQKIQFIQNQNQKRQQMQMQLEGEDSSFENEEDKRKITISRNQMTTREIYRQRFLLQLLKRQHNQLRLMGDIGQEIDNKETQEIDPYILKALQEEFKQQEDAAAANNNDVEGTSSINKQPLSTMRKRSNFTVSIQNLIPNQDAESVANSKAKDSQLQLDFDEMSIIYLQQKLSRDIHGTITGNGGTIDNIDLSEFRSSHMSLERTGDDEIIELEQILKGTNLETLTNLIEQKEKDIKLLEKEVGETSQDEDYIALSQYEMQPDELDIVNNQCVEVENLAEEYDEEKKNQHDENDVPQANSGARGRTKISAGSRLRRTSQDPHENTNNQKENSELRQQISEGNINPKKQQFLFQLKKNHQGFVDNQTALEQLENLKNARFRVESF